MIRPTRWRTAATSALAAVLTSLAIQFTTLPCYANVGETYGFGARSSALGGAVVAGGGDAYSAYYNPGALGQEQVDSQRFKLSWGVLYMQPNFAPIEGVVKENSFNSDRMAGSPNIGDVDTSYRATFGQVIGLSYRVLPEIRNLTVGLVTYFPLQQLAYMDTGEAYLPEYVLYRARTQRPQFEVGMGAEAFQGLSIGAGLHVAYTLTSNAPLFINTGDRTTSAMRFTSSLKPKASPYFGMHWIPQTESKSLTFGGVLRLPVSFDNQMTLTSGARVFGKSAAIDFNFLAASALYYDPLALEVGSTWQVTRKIRLFAQMDYQFWSAFEVPALQIQQPQDIGAGPNMPVISAAALPFYQFSNTVIPRVGQELALGQSSLFRLGYAYQPSFLDGTPGDAGNYLDPPAHVFNVGFNFKFAKFLGIQTPADLDMNLSYMHLAQQTVVKSVGNERGVLNDPKIGSTYPNLQSGYQAGGNVLGGGISLSLAI